MSRSNKERLKKDIIMMLQDGGWGGPLSVFLPLEKIL